MPFAIYIPTSFPDRLGELWWLTLEAVIARNDRIALVMDGEDRRFDCADAADEVRSSTTSSTGGCAASTTEDDLRARVRDLAARYGVDIAAFCDDLCMTWEEIGELAADPLATIGAHTVNHRDAEEGRPMRGAHAKWT